MKKILYTPLPFLVGLILLSTGCSITKRHYAPGYHVEWHKKGSSQLANEKANESKMAEKVDDTPIQSPPTFQIPQQSQGDFISSQPQDEILSNGNRTADVLASYPKEEVGEIKIIEKQETEHFTTQEENHEGINEEKQFSAPPTDNNIFAILGLIFSIIPSFWLLGVVFSIIGLVQIKRDGGEGRKLAVAGLIISGVWLLIFLLYAVAYAILLSQYMV